MLVEVANLAAMAVRPTCIVSIAPLCFICIMSRSAASPNVLML